MSNSEHYLKLENLFYAAPIQALYAGITIQIAKETCTIHLPVSSAHFHGGNALHGAVYFKLLDDAAFFAASSIVLTTFIVTANYEIKLLRPITGGNLTAVGKLEQAKGKVFIATAELFNETGTLMAHGKGTFIQTATPLSSLPGYNL